MIKIDQPAMALNAENVPGPDYKMWNTWRVLKSEMPEKICGWVAEVAKGAPGGKLKNVIFNCHGNPGILRMGVGMDWTDLKHFELLKGLVDNIYLVACEVVSFTGGHDGNMFCCGIAKAAGANVYASSADQTTGLWPTIPYGYIDGYEGKVWKWKSDGSNELTTL
jgi:hypothetical protein